jgi:hypothetical protein
MHANVFFPIGNQRCFNTAGPVDAWRVIEYSAVSDLPEVNMTDPASIAPLHERDFTEFIAYLNDRLSDNGGAEVAISSLCRAASRSCPPNARRRSVQGSVRWSARKGWRRAWVARAADGRMEWSGGTGGRVWASR